MITGERNVSAYEGSPPVDENDRKIADGPLYDRAQVIALVRRKALSLWTRGAAEDAAKWMIDVPDVCRLVEQAVTQGRYIGSEWCIQKPGGPWVASDAYAVTVSEWNAHAQRELDTTWYLKFSISCTGNVLLSVSNHPEGC
ncbi:hypothetical protein D893_02568 [Thioalkalivibrio sp. ALE21]|uniref:hypothetical protein n=1 Tax=Thioalkalivibrio sp. ALE21 TaxID=1158175 RepID=UPI000D9F1597|nr:hypothetical protein [Thioalkalivibrio sp. ALE21]PYF99755.1 hypothetical protein D893_02568 [Thioalkalivibrio sp. ALE21]